MVEVRVFYCKILRKLLNGDSIFYFWFKILCVLLHAEIECAMSCVAALQTNGFCIHESKLHLVIIKTGEMTKILQLFYLTWFILEEGQLDLSTASHGLKSTPLLSCTSTHPTMVSHSSQLWLYVRSINIPFVLTDLLAICFTSIRPTIPEIELFQNLTLKNPRSSSWVRSKFKVTLLTWFSFFTKQTKHSLDMETVCLNL